MRTLHLISHTHWDREWYLTFQQFRLKLVHLVDSLLDILESDPQYKYFLLDGQTILLEDYLAIRPEREAILRQFIQSGRIIIGPWYVLPDEFLVSPEATIRNLLLGDQTCRRFGPKMHIGYSPDQFGHIGQLPQILRGFDIQTACFWRGQSNEACELWWEAPDGSRVFTANLRDGYGYAASLPADRPEAFTAEIRRLRDQLLPFAAAPHLLLMNGTDHMEPSPDTPRAIASTRGLLDGDELIHSTLVNYLTATRAALEGQALPVTQGEMRDSRRMHLLPGVLSTRMWIKQRNYACETLLEKWTEPFSTFAYWIPPERRSPIFQQKSDIVRAAWRLLMQNHPHDSICGCSIDQVHREMQVRFDQVDQIGEEVTRQSLESLAAAIRTQSGGPSEPELAIVVFNPSSRPRTDAVTSILELPASSSGGFALVDETGAVIPFETRGLGSREIINTSLNPKEFQTMFGQIQDGRAAGMTVQDLTVRRDGAQVFILAVMDEGGEPNLVKWDRGMKEIRTCLADPSLTTFNIRARTGSSTRLVFTAPQVPALGYRTFWLRDQPAPNQPARMNAAVRMLMPVAARLAGTSLGKRMIGLLTRRGSPRPADSIENEWFRVEASKDGTLLVLDKRTGVPYAGLNRFIDGGDRGDEYNYSPPEADRLLAARLRHVQSRHGPVQQTMELVLELKIPVELTPDRKGRLQQTILTPITTRITLTNGLPRLDIQTEVENSARDHRLRVHFPAPFAALAGYHDGHFEIVQRPIGVPAYDETWIEQPRPEVPERAFTQVVNDRLGLTIANHGLPEVEILQNEQGHAEIALTLLRCVGWLSRDDFPTRKGHAGPKLATPEAQMPGRWTFEYAILPHAAAADDVIPLAYAYQAPLRAVGSGPHPGSLPWAASFINVKPASFCISTVKEAEDGRGWLVRGYNLTGTGIQVELKPWRRFRRVERVNLAEEKLSDLELSPEGSVPFPVRGHEIATVLFRD